MLPAFMKNLRRYASNQGLVDLLRYFEISGMDKLIGKSLAAQAAFISDSERKRMAEKPGVDDLSAEQQR